MLFDTLVLIARALNQSNVHWGVGASVLLYYHGLVDAPRDIDIITNEADADVVASILGSMGHEEPGDPARSLYSTSRFLEYTVDGTDVDVMAGFAIRHHSGTYVFPFDDRSVTMWKSVEGVIIPFSSLEDWYVLYQLMPGREAKVKLIEDHMRSNGITDEVLLDRALAAELPADVRARTERLLAFCRSSGH
ncbi:MAG: nucleotidyltransferase domain-containing protein [Candidatus Cryosericum sp.]